MGLSPSETLALPLHDYQAAVYHYNRASMSEDDDAPDPLSADEFDEMLISMASKGVH